MTLYGTALFLHIVFAIALVGGTVWLHVAGEFVKRSSTVAEARAHARFLAGSNKAMMPIAVLVLVPALYLAFAGDWWGKGWPVVSLVLFAATGALAGSIVDPGVARLMETLDGTPDGPMTPEIGRSLADPKLTLTLWAMAGADLAIVALMTNKPGYVGAVTVGLVGVVVGAAVGVRENRHVGAPADPAAGAATA
ncbi:MAG: hypothetical protein KY461_00895 [Actinobacteria bacterium]|nr:hypothetical protein [Actinomycetota bacterium]